MRSHHASQYRKKQGRGQGEKAGDRRLGGWKAERLKGWRQEREDRSQNPESRRQEAGAYGTEAETLEDDKNLSFRPSAECIRGASGETPPLI
jgi:hypothetical protein